MTIIKEACVDSLRSAIKAAENGADRIELCEALHVGGISPERGLVEAVFNAISIPLRVMVRPRGGDFVYNEDEIRRMLEEIDYCKELGVDGVVFGFLDCDRRVDKVLTKVLAAKSRPMTVVFHKAFDETDDLYQAAYDLVECEVDAILTSGAMETAKEGISIINEIIRCTDDRLKIIAAGKITSDNLVELMTKINTDEFHGRSIVQF